MSCKLSQRKTNRSLKRIFILRNITFINWKVLSYIKDQLIVDIITHLFKVINKDGFNLMMKKFQILIWNTFLMKLLGVKMVNILKLKMPIYFFINEKPKLIFTNLIRSHLLRNQISICNRTRWLKSNRKVKWAHYLRKNGLCK